MADDKRKLFLTRWDEVGRTLDLRSASWTRLGVELADRHEEPHRHYHGIRHILAVLTVLDDLTASEAVGPVPALAAFFHDAVYVPTRSDNEEESARLAEARLEQVGVAPDTISAVASIIRATATHVPDGTSACDLFLDADLSILGSPDSVYERYVQEIRAEYRFMDADAFAQGRAAILQTLIDRPQLFLTPAGRERFEHQARVNLAAELKVLEAVDSGP